MIPDCTDWFVNSTFLPNPKCPVIFDDIYTGECEVDKQGSCYNTEETKAAIVYIKRLLSWSGKEIHPAHIGILLIFKTNIHLF